MTPLNIGKYIGIVEFCFENDLLLLIEVISPCHRPPPQYISYYYDFDRSVPDHFARFFGSNSGFGVYVTQ